MTADQLLQVVDSLDASNQKLLAMVMEKTELVDRAIKLIEEQSELLNEQAEFINKLQK
jgi:hypothetical protein